MGLFNFKREIKWDKDVMKVTDSVSNIWESIVNEMSDKMENEQTSEVLRHFNIDMSELREYLRDKEAWSRKQAQAIPKWIPVTERLPESAERYLVMRFDYVAKAPFYDLLWFENGRWWNRHFEGDYAVTHWMPLPEPPEPPKEADNG